MPTSIVRVSFFGLIFGCLWISFSTAQSPSDSAVRTIPKTMMCVPSALVFQEDFAPDSVSDRWGFKSEFALRDGGLLRTNVQPKESKRVFLKDTSFGNAIIQFDFRFAGKTTDLRLVTGSGGHYNSVTKISPDYFQVDTPSDKEAGIVPSHVGECTLESPTDKWQTMTVEYWNDEIVSHLGDEQFVLGKHPIIDRTREYFAFQFDLPGASIDNVRIWSVTGVREDWNARRSELLAKQNSRNPIQRNPVDAYKIQYTNVKSHLTLTDSVYRELVARHSELQDELRANYKEAFLTHKQLSKQTAETKRYLKSTDPGFKRMETDVHRSLRNEDAYVLSTYPALARLKEDGIPKQRFVSELGQARAELEAAGDEQLAALVVRTADLQNALHDSYPGAFQDINELVAKREVVRKSLNSDPVFQEQNRVVVDAGKAVKQYELKAAPRLLKLAEAAKAYAGSSKKAGGKQ